MRRAQNADTHAFKQHRLSQNSPFCSRFLLVTASDMLLEPESEKWVKNIDFFHTAKNVQEQATLFQFLDEFL